ncbi:MAG: hypothetical protein ACI81L_000241 [Verrucomicrobiales bacterium]|jgi:hypothetical protein
MSNNASSGNNGRNRTKKRKKSNAPGKKKFDPVGFWGDPTALPNPEGFEISTADSVAVINSLGQPPLPGHGAASPHYFKLVYDRSTQLAAALGMAGEIDDLTPDDPPEPEPDEAGDADPNALDATDDSSDPNELAETGSDERATPVEASTDEAE